MAGEVADGVHVHPLGEPGYLARHVMPNIAAGAAKSGRSSADIAVIVPVMTIVGDSDEERHNERELVRASMSFYGSTPNYAFIWDEAGFEGTTARIREKQKAGDFKGMAAQITDDHIATFATESTWDGLADALIEKYVGIATRIVLYNALGDREPLRAVWRCRSTHIDLVTPTAEPNDSPPCCPRSIVADVCAGLLATDRCYADGRFSRRARSGPPTYRMKSGSPHTTSWSRARDKPT